MLEDKCINDVLNIGSDLEQTILSLAQNIIEITDSKSEIVFLPPLEEGDMTRRCPDNSKMKEILGRPLITFEEGIKNLIIKG
jgi:UDP-glucose 4-epimerase